MLRNHLRGTSNSKACKLLQHREGPVSLRHQLLPLCVRTNPVQLSVCVTLGLVLAGGHARQYFRWCGAGHSVMLPAI